MGRFIYSPATLKRVNKVCKDKAFNVFQKLIHHVPSAKINEVEDFLLSFSNFIRDNQHELGAIQYVLAIDFTKSGNGSSEPISPKVILDAIKEEDNVLNCTKSLEVLSTEEIDSLNMFSIAKKSSEINGIAVFVENGVDASIYINGVPTEHINPLHPKAGPPENNKFKRNGRDYELALIDFYKVEVRPSRTDHWHDKANRVLVGNRKTEDVFQQALYQWLNQNLSYCTVTQKVRKLSTDETDIEIMEHGGKNHLLEIKWLGKNPSTEYKYDKVEAAIHQVKNYLEQNPETLSAALVVYDGRKQEEFDLIECDDQETNNWKLIRESNGVKLPEKGAGYIFFLLSETASKRVSA